MNEIIDKMIDIQENMLIIEESLLYNSDKNLQLKLNELYNQWLNYKNLLTK